MSEPTPQIEKEADPITVDDVVDPWLQTLVAVANDGLLDGAQITLQVHGMLVSGKLTSRTNYFEEGVAKSNLSPVSGDAESTQWIRDLFGPEAYKRRDEEAAAAGVPIRTWYIHLRDARMFHPSGQPIPSDSGVWWRGKISSVDGYFFGSLRVGDA